MQSPATHFQSELGLLHAEMIVSAKFEIFSNDENPKQFQSLNGLYCKDVKLFLCERNPESSAVYAQPIVTVLNRGRKRCDLETAANLENEFYDCLLGR